MDRPQNPHTPDGRIVAAIFLTLLLPACSAIESVKVAVERVGETVGEIKQSVGEIRSEADVNKDGTVSGSEWRDYLLGLLGIGGVGGASLLAKRNGASNERKAKLEAEVNALKERVTKTGG